METILKVDSLHKSYGKKEVIKNLSFEIKEGEIVGLIGKNGVGKSTTIDCIIGSKNFEKGEIEINSISLKKDPLMAKKMFGYVPSEPCLYENMTGNEYLSFIGSIYDIKDDIFIKNVNLLKSKFDLTDEDLNNKIKNYSHGMKQKLALMSSLINNPKVWILDEPTVGLDIMVYESLVEVMKDYASHKKCILLTSHNLELVSKICSRVLIINNGGIAKEISFIKEPYLRGNLSKIFFEIYNRG